MKQLRAKFSLKLNKLIPNAADIISSQKRKILLSFPRKTPRAKVELGIEYKTKVHQFKNKTQVKSEVANTQSQIYLYLSNALVILELANKMQITFRRILDQKITNSCKNMHQDANFCIITSKLTECKLLFLTLL